MLPLLAAAALLLGGAVSAAAYLSADSSAAAPDFAVVPTALRVRLLGLDGLDRAMADQMISRGEMPHLQALLSAGAHATLRPEPEQVPAIVWTTIATGRGPEAHGIRSTGARRLPGMSVPVPLGADDPFARALGTASDLLRLGRAQPATSVLRRAKTFWNVASEKGLRVAVVDWWATWPADAVNGAVVTERALFKLEKSHAANGHFLFVCNKENTKVQVQATSDRLSAIAEGLAMDGYLDASGVLLAARQAIRVLWTKLHPPAAELAEPPELRAVE